MPLFYIFHTHENAHSYCTLIVCPRASLSISIKDARTLSQGRWYNKDGSIPPVLLAHATRGALLTMKNLTFEEIRKAPTSYLRKCLREDLDVEIADMISKELFEIREVE